MFVGLGLELTLEEFRNAMFQDYDERMFQEWTMEKFGKSYSALPEWKSRIGLCPGSHLRVWAKRPDKSTQEAVPASIFGQPRPLLPTIRTTAPPVPPR